jgi:integrase
MSQDEGRLPDHRSALGSARRAVPHGGPGGAPLWPSSVRAELTAAAKRAKVGPLTPNMLRHSAATLMADQLPLHQVADVLGHTTTRMLEQTYRHRPTVVPVPEVL